MEWPKLKNIILVLLAITNLCLLAFVVNRQWQGRAARQEAREGAIAFLEGKGIQVEEEQVPQAVALTPQIVTRDLEGEKSLAEALLQGEVETEPRGGEVYRYYNERGYVQFHGDGAFLADFAPGAVSLGEDREAACLAALAKLGFEGQLLEQTEAALTFRQSWEGAPLFTQQVTLMCGEDDLQVMTAGRRLVGEPAADSTRVTITVATALIDFYNGLNALGDVCSRVDAITQGYVSVASLSGAMTLTPVWRINTDTGAYQLDLVGGELTRVFQDA